MEITKKAMIRSDCPISYTLDLFGDKWSLLIIRDMMFSGKRTYSEFLNSEEKMASNIARDRLVKLTVNGFIVKGDSTQRHWNRPYLLTEKAISLVPLIFDMIEWGAQFVNMEENMSKLIVDFAKNRNKSIAALQSSLREQNAM